MTLPMTKATYRAHALACGFGVAKTGTHQIFVQCAIVEYSDEAEKWVNTGDEITWIGSFTAGTEARTIESLGHFGWKGDDLAELDNPDEQTLARLMPDFVDLVCEPEEYEGALTLKVRWVNHPGAGKFAFKEPLAGDALKSFAARMKGTIRGTRGAAGARSSTPPTRPAQSPSRGNGGARHPNAPDDDKLPF